MSVKYFVDKNKVIKIIAKQVFSLQNTKDKKHKVLTICGVKFKFKRKPKDSIVIDINNHYKGTKTPRILVVSHEFSLTGAPKVALILAKTLKKIFGISPVVMTLRDGQMKQEFVDSGLFIIDPKRIKLTKKYLEKIAPRFDIIILHSWTGPLLGKYDKKNMPPMIWYCHEAFNAQHFYKLHPLIKETMLSMTQCWAGSPLTQDGMHMICSQRTTDLLLYGVSEFNINNDFDTSDKINFLLPATLESRKGQDVLVNAIKLLPQDVQSKANFVLIGKEVQKTFCEEFNELVKDLPMVKVIDEVPFDELIKYYDQANCVIVPSRFDPMPMVATYGLMSGKLCIVSDVIGTAKLLTDMKNGIIFENENIEELSEKLADIITNFDNYKQIAKNGRQVFEEHFSIESFENSVKNKTEKLIPIALKLRRKRMLEKIFSVKNIGINKVFCILGFELKFKLKKLIKKHKSSENSFVEDIFSVKKSLDRKHKIFTILGLKIKLKRKPNISDLYSELEVLKKQQKQDLKQLGSQLKVQQQQVAEQLSEQVETQLQQLSQQLTNINDGNVALLNDIKFSLGRHIAATMMEQVANAQSIINLHSVVFPKYRDIYKNKDVVIVATGPSMNHYEVIDGAIHIGVNSACKQNIVNLDYLFAIDYKNVKSYLDTMVSYRGDLCKKFFGLFINKFDDIKIPEKYAQQANAERFYIDYNDITYSENFYPDISVSPLPSFWSITFCAINFALWTGAKKIYIVGCDSNYKGHFDGSGLIIKEDNIVEQHKIKNMDGWNKLRNFASIHYSDTEIISVNPVGLKGMFKDVYTESYLAEHPEIREELRDNIEILETKEVQNI